MFVDKEELRRKYANFAVEAYKDFMNKNASLNDSITKIAWDNELSSQEIKRVVETVNHLVQETLLKEARSEGKERTFAFNIADPKIIDEKIAGKRSRDKKAGIINKRASSLFNEYSDLAANVDIMNIFKSHEKTASDVDDLFRSPEERELYRAQAIDELVKEGHVLKRKISDMESEKVAACQMISETAEELKSVVESSMFNEGLSFIDIYKMACSVTKHPVMNNKIFTHIRSDLIKEGSSVKDKLIAKPMGTKDFHGQEFKGDIMVVNGDHKIVYIMDNLNEYYQGYDTIRQKQFDLHQAKDAVIKEIRNVMDTDDVRKYLDGKYRKNIGEDVSKYNNYKTDEDPLCGIPLRSLVGRRMRTYNPVSRKRKAKKAKTASSKDDGRSI